MGKYFRAALGAFLVGLVLSWALGTGLGQSLEICIMAAGIVIVAGYAIERAKKNR